MAAALAVWWIGRPLYDLWFLRLEIDDDGVTLRKPFRRSPVRWKELVTAHVRLQLELETTRGTVRIPRNVRGYRELFQRLKASEMVAIPELVQWTTTRVWGRVFLLGTVLVGWGVGHRDISLPNPEPGYAVLAVGALLMVAAVFSWGRWQAEEGVIRFSGVCLAMNHEVVGVREWHGDVVGFPHCYPAPGFGPAWLSLGGSRCPAELLGDVVGMVRTDSMVRAAKLARPRDAHLWAIWIIIACLVAPGWWVLDGPEGDGLSAALALLLPFAMFGGTGPGEPSSCGFRPADSLA